MRKILLSIFVISTILTSSFFVFNKQKAEAINDPAITSVTLDSATQDPTTKDWIWLFTLRTNSIVADGQEVTFSARDANTTMGPPLFVSTEKVGPGGQKFRLPGLKDQKFYSLEWKIQTPYCGVGYDGGFAVLKATYICKSGFTDLCSSTVENKIPSCVKHQDAAVNVGVQKPVVTNNNIYKFLAPIGGMKCQDSTGLDKSCIGNNIGDYLNIIFKLGIGLAAALAVIMLIINGITYMGDESIFSKTEAKSKMFSAILGLLIALGAWALLNTINPDLTGGGGLTIDPVSIELVRDRADDPNFVNNIGKFNTSNIAPSSYSDPLFLGYMAHQQGSAGISAILWAEKNGLTEVPTDNPYTKSDINKNMKNNFIASDAQKVIGTSVLTPANFLKYWALKTAAAKATTTPQIFPSVDTELTKVASETGVDITTLRAICRIESAGGCTNESSITTVNSGGYSGLFQLSKSVFDKYKNKTKNQNILDAYDNALVAALYYKDNLSSVKV